MRVDGGSGCASARAALGGDDGADLLDRPGVEHVARLDPAAPRRDDAELHLAPEHLGAVTVAVDADGGAGGDRPPRERAVEIEVRRRAVDLDARSGVRPRAANSRS